MANVGDKYIIELTKRYNDRSFYVEGIDRVVTIKELDKLEKYNREYIADCETAYDKGFRNGLEKAWEMAKKIVLEEVRGGYTGSECVEIFGSYSGDAILINNTVFRALEKIEAYEKQKAEKDKIKDGDEVSLDDGTKGVVVFSSTDGHLNVVNAYGGMRSYNATQVIKTGRHFPQMVEIMKEMRDNDG